jgi:hypothetical protein
MTRAEVAALIGKATDLPPMVRATAMVFLARMTDRQIAELGVKAEAVMGKLREGDRLGFESALASIGLPPQFVAFLSAKAFENANKPAETVASG